jgi:hypothetical protein
MHAEARDLCGDASSVSLWYVTPTGYHLGGVYSTPMQMLNGVSAMIFIDLMFWKTAAVSDSRGGAGETRRAVKQALVC